MKSQQPEAYNKIVSVARLLNMCDGVFSIVMTLLILGIKVDPMKRDGLHRPLQEQLVEAFPNIEMYIMSFIIVGAFWILHHYHFHYIIRSDKRLIWINVIYLMFISLIPFTSDLLGDFPADDLAVGIFGANIVIICFLVFLNWRHATRNHHLVHENLDPEFIASVSRRIFMYMGFFLAATVISLLSVHIGGIVFILVPFILKLYDNKEILGKILLPDITGDKPEQEETDAEREVTEKAG